MQQQAVECNFAENDSWIILSAIEQSIKRKIEAVGTPLKDWDIRINYGIKTGFNETFVITTDKRNEILANCQTEDERTRTAELIRPILRGRDIKRYAYNWAGLYLIATFPSRHYDIEMYPAVKQYLLTFGIEKLEQTGKTYIVNGEKIKARKKTEKISTRADKGDTPYNLRNCAYMEDFSKPKIVWGNLNLTPNYALVENNSFINAPSSMIVPASKYLLAILNSKIADFYIKLLGVTRNGGYFEYKPMFIEQLPIPQLKIENKELAQIERLIDNNNYTEIEYIVYNLYGLTQDEINYINSL